MPRSPVELQILSGPAKAPEFGHAASHSTLDVSRFTIYHLVLMANPDTHPVKAQKSVIAQLGDCGGMAEPTGGTKSGPQYMLANIFHAPHAFSTP
jgi:hypothetical protein